MDDSPTDRPTSKVIQPKYQKVPSSFVISTKNNQKKYSKIDDEKKKTRRKSKQA